MKLQEKEASAYEAEYQNIAERLMREMPPFKEAEQLLELVQTHFSLAARRAQQPKVMILVLRPIGFWAAVCKPAHGPVNWPPGTPTR